MTRSEPDEPCVFEEDDPAGKEGKSQFVANLQAGATVGYKYFDFSGEQPAGRLAVRVRGSQGSEIDGQMLVSLDQPDGKRVAAVAIKQVAGTQAWSEFTTKLPAICGTHAVYLTWQGEGNLDFKSFRMT
jgi:hypothetical protein